MLGKKFKTVRNAISRKKIIALFSSTSFTMDVAKKMESLTLYNNGSADLPQQENNNEFVDLKDLKIQAMSKAEEIQTVQQKLVAVQRQIANSSTKNGAPPKQLLLYLVR